MISQFREGRISRFPAVLPTTYRHLDPERVQTIFDLLEADERTT